MTFPREKWRIRKQCGWWQVWQPGETRSIVEFPNFQELCAWRRPRPIRVRAVRWLGQIRHWNIEVRPYDAWVVAGSFQDREHALTVAHDSHMWGVAYGVPNVLLPPVEHACRVKIANYESPVPLKPGEAETA